MAEFLHLRDSLSHVLTCLHADEAAVAAGVASAWRDAARIAPRRLAITHRRAEWTWPDVALRGSAVADVVLHTTNAGAADIEALLLTLARGPSAGALRRLVVSRCFSIIYRRSGPGCFPRALPAFTSLHTLVLSDISDLAWPADVVLPAVHVLALTNSSIVSLPMPAGGDTAAASAAAAAVGWADPSGGGRPAHATTLSMLLSCFPGACVAFLGGVTFVAPRTFMAAHFPALRAGGALPHAPGPEAGNPPVLAATGGGGGEGAGSGSSSGEASRSNAALHANIFGDAITGALAGLPPTAVAARRGQFAAAVVGACGMDHRGIPGVPHPSLQVVEVTFWPDEMQALASCLLAPAVSTAPADALAHARRVVDFSRADDAMWLAQLRTGLSPAAPPASAPPGGGGAPTAPSPAASPSRDETAPSLPPAAASATEPSPSAASDGSQRRWRPQSRSAVLAHLLATANARPTGPPAVVPASAATGSSPSASAAAGAAPPSLPVTTTGPRIAVATAPPPTRRTRSNPTGAMRPAATLADIVKGADWPGVLALTCACHAPVTRSTPLHQLAYEPTGSTTAIAHAQALVGMQLHAPRDDIVRRLLNRKVMGGGGAHQLWFQRYRRPRLKPSHDGPSVPHAVKDGFRPPHHPLPPPHLSAECSRVDAAAAGGGGRQRGARPAAGGSGGVVAGAQPPRGAGAVRRGHAG
jgi:hypothetical protein